MKNKYKSNISLLRKGNVDKNRVCKDKSKFCYLDFQTELKKKKINGGEYRILKNVGKIMK